MKTEAELAEELVAAEDAKETPEVTAFGERAAPRAGARATAAATYEQVSRRERARLEREAEKAENDRRFRDLEGRLSTTAQETARLREENARLHGFVSARSQEPAPARVSADELHRQAEAALDSGKYAEWKRLDRLANRVETEELLESRLAQIPQPQQQAPAERALPVDFQIALANHLRDAPKLAATPNWQTRVDRQAALLMAEGHAPGPELLARAVKDCEARLTGTTARATFSTNGRGILGGDRHVNSGQASGDDGESGTAEQRAMWAKFKLPASELKKYA
jgi:hypothetical protein